MSKTCQNGAIQGTIPGRLARPWPPGLPTWSLDPYTSPKCTKSNLHAHKCHVNTISRWIATHARCK